MANQDNRAADERDHQTDNDNSQTNADLTSVLQLISAQVEDTDRRQTQILEQLAQRLDQLESGAKAVREKLTTQQAASPDTSSEEPGLPEDPTSESLTPDFEIFSDQENTTDKADSDALDRVAVSLAELAEQISKPASSIMSASEDTQVEIPEWADDVQNDLATPEENQGNALKTSEVSDDESQEIPSLEDKNSVEQETEIPEAASTLDEEPDLWVDNAADQEPELEKLSDHEVTEPQLDENQLSESTSEPWSSDDAEALMQAYEQELLVDEQEIENQRINPTMHAVSNSAEAALFSVKTDHAATIETNAPNSGIEREWLEEKFGQIADRVEQTLEEIRSEDPVNALRERFSQFQDDIAGALSDVATRSDIEGLKTAEAEIEELRTHFDRVQDQLTRLDAVEKQLEIVTDRLSDDRLTTLISSNSESNFDQGELVSAVGEYVANQATTDNELNKNNNTKLDQLQELLTAFIVEQRTGKDQQLGVLDTLQDAMVQLLDRADTHSVQQQFVQPDGLDGQAQATVSSIPDSDGLAQYVPVTPELQAQPGQHLDGDPANVTENSPTEDDLSAMSLSAIEAASMASNRHPGFEPFSTEAATSAQRSLDSDSDDTEIVTRSEPDALPQSTSAQEPKTMEPLEAGVPMQDPRAQDAQEDLSHVYQPDEIPDADQTSEHSIARLRQEFIVEARRAKAQAEIDEAAEALALESIPKSKGFELFGFSLGGKSKAAPKRAGVANVQLNADELHMEPKIFGMPRKTVLIGAFILMTAASGILLLIPRSAPPQPQAPAIERIIPNNLSTNPESLPQTSGPQTQGAETDGTQTGTTPATEKVPFKGGHDDGLAPMGDRSEIIEPWSRTTSQLSGPGRKAVALLNGVALQSPSRPVTKHELDYISNQQSMAHWSLKLGDAAYKATPAGLLPEYQQAVQSVSATDQASLPVQRAALQKMKTPSSTATSSKKRSQLDLPPASVGPLSLRLAAAKGDPSAEFEVGSRLAGGKGTSQNFKLAVKWYTRSASRGFAQSQYRLGTFYERGLGVKKDQSRARIWYRRAAEQGNTKAMHNLAVLSAGGSKGAPDYTTASHWFSQAAQYGLADSQYNLAVLFENGLGIKKDAQKAYQYYALAARSGDKDAQKRRDFLKAKLSQGDLAKAKALVSDWQRKMPDKMANDAFAAGQAWKTRTSNNAAN